MRDEAGRDSEGPTDSPPWEGIKGTAKDTLTGWLAGGCTLSHNADGVASAWQLTDESVRPLSRFTYAERC